MDNLVGSLLLFLAKHAEERFTIRQLSLSLRIPYATLYRLVLRTGDGLRKERVGSAITLRIDLADPLILHRLVLAAEEERRRFLRQPLFRALATHPLPSGNALVLFGSEAKGGATARSDVDLLILGDGQKRVSFTDEELLYRRRINPLFLSYREFSEMLGDVAENVGKQIRAGHVILQGPETFWRITVETLRAKVR